MGITYGSQRLCPIRQDGMLQLHQNGRWDFPEGDAVNLVLRHEVPLNGELTYDVVRPFAKAIAELMEQRHPGFIVSQMSKELRSKKVFMD